MDSDIEDEEDIYNDDNIDETFTTSIFVVDNTEAEYSLLNINVNAFYSFLWKNAMFGQVFELFVTH